MLVTQEELNNLQLTDNLSAIQCNQYFIIIGIIIF